MERFFDLGPPSFFISKKRFFVFSVQIPLFVCMSRRYLDQGATFWAETWQVPSLVPGIEIVVALFLI